jgi:hypothetical protein
MSSRNWPPPRFNLDLRRAFSTRIRRMASAKPRQKNGAVLPGPVAIANHAQPRFMHQRGRLQRLPGTSSCDIRIDASRRNSS